MKRLVGFFNVRGMKIDDSELVYEGQNVNITTTDGIVHLKALLTCINQIEQTILIKCEEDGGPEQYFTIPVDDIKAIEVF